MAPFQLALAANEAQPPSRGSFGPKHVTDAEKGQKSTRSWNPWMMMK